MSDCLICIAVSSRAATIMLSEDNCHFLRVDKDDFNRILRVSSTHLLLSLFLVSIPCIYCLCIDGHDLFQETCTM